MNPTEHHCRICFGIEGFKQGTGVINSAFINVVLVTLWNLNRAEPSIWKHEGEVKCHRTFPKEDALGFKCWCQTGEKRRGITKLFRTCLVEMWWIVGLGTEKWVSYTTQVPSVVLDGRWPCFTE